ncbi:MAG: MraY family glycosyltransferase [Eubacteriales bacterium]|nr:MraY family glycosyltransferase [Eubacteriales bacterium]
MFGTGFNYMDCFITFILAFIITFSATPVAKRLSIKLGAVDSPKDERRMHKKPIARMGGLAIISGFVVSVLFVVFTSLSKNGADKEINRQLIGIFVGILIIAGVGIVDDIKKLGAWPKFAMQIIATLAVVVISDMRITILTNPFDAAAPYFVLPDYISYPLTVLWIVGITNAINLIDGLDGLAAGITSISCLSLFFINLYTNQGLSIMPLVSVLILALAGSSVGFLPYNFYPAKIIMGDTGAYFLGFILGIISIQGALKSFTAISISIPLIVLGLPVFDTLTSIIRRIRNHKKVTVADRGHIHHRLIDMGLSHKQTVIIMYIASAGLGLAAMVMAEKGALSAVILILLIAVFVVSGAFNMKELNRSPEDNDDESYTCVDSAPGDSTAEACEAADNKACKAADNKAGNAADNKSCNAADSETEVDHGQD